MDQYILYGEIGRGSSSIAYKGRRKNTVQYLVVKSVDKALMKIVEKECSLLKRLNHRNVLKCIDCQETTNHVWVVSPYVTGPDLRTLISQDIRLPVSCVRDFGIHIVRGLCYLHGQGIICGNLKPASLLVDGDGSVIFHDLSFSIAVNDTNNQLDSIGDEECVRLGSPCYMAPELFKERTMLTRASDFWALGCVLFEMWVGTSPFMEQTVTELIKAILYYEPLPLSPLISADVPDSNSLTDLLISLLKKSPTQRMNWKDLKMQSFWTERDVHDSEEMNILVDFGDDDVSKVDDHFANIVAKQGWVDAPERKDIRDSPDVLDFSSRIYSVRDSEGDINISTVVDGDGATVLEMTSTNVEVSWAELNASPSNYNSDDNDSTDHLVQYIGDQFCSDIDEGINDINDVESEFKAVLGKSWYNGDSIVSEVMSEEQPIMTDSKFSETNLHENTNNDSINSVNTKIKEATHLMESKLHQCDVSFSDKTPSLNGEELYTPVLYLNSAITSEVTSTSDMSPDEKTKAKPSLSFFRDPLELIFSEVDMSISPIMRNPRIEHLPPNKFESRLLPFAALSGNEFLSLDLPGLEAHLTKFIKGLDRGSIRSRLNVLSYFATISVSSAAANIIINSSLMELLLYKVSTRSQPSKLRACVGQTIGRLVRHATFISEEFDITAVMVVLTDALRESWSDQLLVRQLVPTLGELLFYVCSQPRYSDTHRKVPGSVIAVFVRCLRDSNDTITRHYAVKTIENVASVVVAANGYTNAFTTLDVVLLLWSTLYKTKDSQLRQSAACALDRLCRRSVVVLQWLIEKVGTKDFVAGMMGTCFTGLETDTPATLAGSSMSMTGTSGPVQRCFLNMICVALCGTIPKLENSSFDESAPTTLLKIKTALIEEPAVLNTIIGMSSSSSALLRGKAHLALSQLCSRSNEVMLACCDLKMLNLLDKAESEFGNNDVRHSNEYTKAADRDYHCFCILVNSIVEVVPRLISGLVASLDAVSGRRHPSFAQTRVLKTEFLSFNVLLHITSSARFRERVVTPAFVDALVRLLHHVNDVVLGQTNVCSVGATASFDFSRDALIIVENILTHHMLLLRHFDSIIGGLLPALVALSGREAGDSRVISVRLVADAMERILSLNLDYDSHLNEDFERPSLAVQKTSLNEIINSVLCILPNMLDDDDPMPVYALRLCHSIIAYSSEYVGALVHMGLIVRFLDVALAPFTRTDDRLTKGYLQVYIIELVRILLSSEIADLGSILRHPLEPGKSSLCSRLSALLLAAEANASETVLASASSAALSLLRFASSVVRRTLHPKSSSVSSVNETEASANNDSAREKAEAILRSVEPLTTVTSTFIGLLSCPQIRTRDIASEALFIATQLYGGHHVHLMTSENISKICAGLVFNDDNNDGSKFRIQKRILKVIKQLASSKESVMINNKDLTKSLECMIKEGEDNYALAIDVLSLIISESKE